MKQIALKKGRCRESDDLLYSCVPVTTVITAILMKIWRGELHAN